MLDITKLLTVMVEHDASDLYLTTESAPMYRINGIVRPAGSRKLNDEDTHMFANSIMNDKQQKEFEETNEHNLALYFPNLGRFRVKSGRCFSKELRYLKDTIAARTSANSR